MSAFPFSSNFCCLKKLNKVIHRLLAAGLFQKLSDDANMILELKLELRESNETDVSHKLGLHDFKRAWKSIGICLKWTLEEDPMPNVQTKTVFIGVRDTLHIFSENFFLSNSVSWLISEGSAFIGVFLKSEINSWKWIGKCLKKNSKKDPMSNVPIKTIHYN